MKQHVLHNWILKLAAIVAAVLLWAAVYDSENPVTTKRFVNVPVTFVNEEEVIGDNQVYEVLDESDIVKSVVVSAPSSVLNELSEGDISIEADFTKMKLDGTIDLSFSSSMNSNDVSFKASATELRLNVEPKVEKYLTLEAYLDGAPASGFVPGTTTMAQNRISVSGAESIVNNITSAIAWVDISGTSGDVFTYADIILRDAEGNDVSTERLTLSSKSVSTTVEILATKTVPVTYEYTGEPAANYIFDGEITSSVTELTVAGRESVLRNLEELVITGEALTIEDAEGDVTISVDLDDYMPAGIRRADRTTDGIAEVTFHVEPIISVELSVSVGQLTFANVPSGYSVGQVDRTDTILVTARGPESIVTVLENTDIYMTFDVTEWMEDTNRTRLSDDTIYNIYPSFVSMEGVTLRTSETIEIYAVTVEE